MASAPTPAPRRNLFTRANLWIGLTGTLAFLALGLVS
ncbi:MAG: hypothetical protein JWN11_879, partial [Hyphomicrobiales bacterium]|nr:hypothetical protein [Hyphomicrobiales bacterium]